MRLATVDEARAIDARSQSEGALSGELLMEAAGALAAREIREFISKAGLTEVLKDRPMPKDVGRFIAVVCGPGGNGGDGLVVARHLSSVGLHVRVYLTGEKSTHVGFRENLDRLPADVARMSPTEMDELRAGVFIDRTHVRPALIVDALLGLGTSRDVKGIYSDLIETMNASEAPTISLDLPSGLDADSGGLRGVAVVAEMTLTFGLAKRGFFVNEGPRHVGRLRVLPVGFPIDLVREIACTQTAFGSSSARYWLPKRRSSSNKSSHGRVVVFAGQPRMIGAGLLAGIAAMRAGTGYVTLVTHLATKDAKARAEIASVAPEFLTLASEDPEIWDKIGTANAVVGPGFGIGSHTLKILEHLNERRSDGVVVDADALTTLAQEKKAGRKLPLRKSWILTPHAGELARLMGGEAKDLEADRFGAAEGAARELGAIVLFKGFRTVVSDGRRTAVILSGNSALAKAGSGDTLAGLIGGCLAQKVPPFEAACLGAYIHGRLADDWLASGRDRLALQPTDLANSLPGLLRQIRSSP